MKYVLTIYDVLEMQVLSTLSVKSNSCGEIDENDLRRLLRNQGFEEVSEDSFYRLSRFNSIASTNTSGVEYNLQITRCD